MYTNQQQQQTSLLLEESLRKTATTKGSVELGEFYDLAQIDWTWPRQKIIDEVFKELKTMGFFLITNVPGYDESDLLHWGKWFCSLSEEEKKKLHKRVWNSENKNIYRGLAPFIDNDPSHVEIFDMGLPYDQVTEEEKEYSLHEETPWPVEPEESKQFREYMEGHYNLRVSVASELVGMIAEGLGKPAGFFDQWYSHDTLITIAQHTDSGFVTLLSTLGYPGLQVLVNDEFRSVRPVKHAFVINIGDMLSRITNYILKATLHRVIDIGDDRYSSPFFFEPHYAAKIPSTIMDKESLSVIENDANKARDADEVEKQYEEMLYGDYLIDKITGYCLAYQGLWKGKRSDMLKKQLVEQEQ
ncbi:2og-fe oxygenase [Stylonychia lemnae]|uniref:2og-fe oxygenase n=1 Tax=Stylonychia lemnae TaxID=5949 RepID=A0A077ZRY7_STYLE|nr:2og-fe oxygenase [Stylonychia lemnae]|eukprot:CDW72244.1 2og-fe oxygenase [Stylonychia lemnae]